MYRAKPSRISSTLVTCMECGAQGYAPSIHARFCSPECQFTWDLGSYLFDKMFADIERERDNNLTYLMY